MSNPMLQNVVLVASDALVKVTVKFGEEGGNSLRKGYAYVAHQTQGIRTGDFVVVPVRCDNPFAEAASSGNSYEEHMKVVRVENVEPADTIDLDAKFPYRFVIDKLNPNTYFQLLTQRDDMTDILRRKRHRRVVAEVVDSLGVSLDTVGRGFAMIDVSKVDYAEGEQRYHASTFSGNEKEAVISQETADQLEAGNLAVQLDVPYEERVDIFIAIVDLALTVLLTVPGSNSNDRSVHRWAQSYNKLMAALDFRANRLVYKSSNEIIDAASYIKKWVDFEVKRMEAGQVTQEFIAMTSVDLQTLYENEENIADAVMAIINNPEAA